MTIDTAQNGFRIRTATIDDWETIADFNIRLAAETESKQLDPDTVRAGVRQLLADAGHGRYFVACDGDDIIGQIMHTREWSDWRNGEIWWLQSVYIRPDRRRGGVFRGLFRHLEKLAEQSPGVVGLRLYVEQHNSSAQEAYRTLGLLDAGYTVLERFFSATVPSLPTDNVDPKSST